MVCQLLERRDYQLHPTRGSPPVDLLAPSSLELRRAGFLNVVFELAQAPVNLSRHHRKRERARTRQLSQCNGTIGSSNGNTVLKIDVLDGVEHFDALVPGALEDLATGNKAGAAGAFVDDGGADSLGVVVFAGSTTGVD